METDVAEEDEEIIEEESGHGGRITAVSTSASAMSHSPPISVDVPPPLLISSAPHAATPTCASPLTLIPLGSSSSSRVCFDRHRPQPPPHVRSQSGRSFRVTTHARSRPRFERWSKLHSRRHGKMPFTPSAAVPTPVRRRHQLRFTYSASSRTRSAIVRCVTSLSATSMAG
jgi:hypothetical protein